MAITSIIHYHQLKLIKWRTKITVDILGHNFLTQTVQQPYKYCQYIFKNVEFMACTCITNKTSLRGDIYTGKKGIVVLFACHVPSQSDLLTY